MISTNDRPPKMNLMKPGPLFGSGACRSFLQAVCDPVLVTDDEGRIVFCNEAAAELTGHHVNQLVGAMIGTAVDGWKLHWDKNVCSRNVEAVVQRRDGADIPVEMSFAIWDEDGRRMIGAIIRSTIARRSAEAMQAAAQVNRAGFSGGSNFQIGWSHDEQNDEQVFA